MIEVERKFQIPPSLVKQIEQDGLFLGQTKIHDTYFDTPDYRLTLQNAWLRKRDGQFELKKSVTQESGLIDRYDEITDELSILKALHLPSSSSLTSSFEKEGIVPFCSFWTDRRKFQLDPFIIDIDTADFGTLTYAVAEIELLVHAQDEIPLAEEQINAFFKKHNLSTEKRILGKLAYYISQKRPHHFAALVAAKVLHNRS